jgi:hypothetical protein
MDRLTELEAQIEKLSERCLECNTIVWSPLSVYDYKWCNICKNKLCLNCWEVHDRDNKLNSFANNIKQTLLLLGITISDVLASKYDNVGCKPPPIEYEEVNEKEKVIDYDDLENRIKDIEDRLDNI